MADLSRRTVIAGLGAGTAAVAAGGRVFGASAMTGGADLPDAELLDLFAEWRALAAESMLRERQLHDFMAPHDARFAPYRGTVEMPESVRADRDALWERFYREVETDEASEARSERLWTLEERIQDTPARSAAGVFARMTVLMWNTSAEWSQEDRAAPDIFMSLQMNIWDDVDKLAPELRLGQVVRS